jgi:hypothetical protein
MIVNIIPPFASSTLPTAGIFEGKFAAYEFATDWAKENYQTLSSCDKASTMAKSGTLYFANACPVDGGEDLVEPATMIKFPKTLYIQTYAEMYQWIEHSRQVGCRTTRDSNGKSRTCCCTTEYYYLPGWSARQQMTLHSYVFRNPPPPPGTTLGTSSVSASNVKIAAIGVAQKVRDYSFPAPPFLMII